MLDYQKANSSTRLDLYPIQWLILLSYSLFRIIVGLVLITLGSRHVRAFRELVVTVRVPLLPIPRTVIVVMIAIEFVAGALLLLGFPSQLGALLLIILALTMLIRHERFPHPSIPDRLTYVLLLGCGLSLLIGIAGAFVFDLPT